MIKTALTIFFITIGTLLSGQELDEYKWEYRIVIVKGSKEKQKTFKKQMLEFERFPEGMADRKLIILEVVDDVFKLFYPLNEKIINSGTTSEKFKRKMLNKNNSFEVLLLGLDGGIKLRKSEIITAKELFNVIDSMPMRQSEMRRRKGNE